MPRLLKVAFIVVDDRFATSAPLPFFGAAPTALLKGFEELDGEVEIHIVCCTMGDHPRPEKLGRNIWFHSEPVPKWGFLRTLHFGCHRAVRKMIREIQPDIVHAQGTERWCANSPKNRHFGGAVKEKRNDPSEANYPFPPTETPRSKATTESPNHRPFLSACQSQAAHHSLQRDCPS